MIREWEYLKKNVIKMIGFAFSIVLIYFTVNGQNMIFAAEKANLSYSITLDPNKGDVKSKNKNVTVGKTYGKLPTPTRKHYVFEGWYTLASGGVRITESSTVKKSSAHTLYAHWQGEEIPITLEANEGELKDTTVTIRFASKYKQQLPIPNRVNYKFDGWYTALTGGDKVVSKSIFNENTPKTLYAHWTPRLIKINFYPLNGDDIYSLEVECGKSIGQLPEPKQEGYNLSGWYFEKDYRALTPDEIGQDGITEHEIGEEYMVIESTPRKALALWVPDNK